MKRCLWTLAAVVAFSLSGCGLLEPGEAAQGATGGQAAAETPTPLPTASARSGFGSTKDAAHIPDPCTLLTKEEVLDLTGRRVTQIDEDGAAPGDTVRYCQWQQVGGQLAVFLSRTTTDEFRLQTVDARSVDGVGDEAFSQAGHLYVRYGTTQLDVYSRGALDDENIDDAKQTAKLLIPRL